MNAPLRHSLPKIRKGNKAGLQPEVERCFWIEKQWWSKSGV